MVLRPVFRHLYHLSLERATVDLHLRKCLAVTAVMGATKLPRETPKRTYRKGQLRRVRKEAVIGSVIYGKRYGMVDGRRRRAVSSMFTRIRDLARFLDLGEFVVFFVLITAWAVLRTWPMRTSAAKRLGQILLACSAITVSLDIVLAGSRHRVATGRETHFCCKHWEMYEGGTVTDGRGSCCLGFVLVLSTMVCCLHGEPSGVEGLRCRGLNGLLG